MKKTIPLMIALILLKTSIWSQVKYKKEVQPLIQAKTYSNSALKVGLRFHKQNCNSDGSLTDKAVLIAYDQMFQTRVYLGDCYYSLAMSTLEPIKLDSSWHYYMEAYKMKVEDPSSAKAGVDRVKSGREELKRIIRQKEFEQAKKQKEINDVQLKEKYALKSSIVEFVSTEFVGHCKVQFKSESAEDLLFLNPQSQILGIYYKGNNECGIKNEFSHDKFEISYRLGKIEIYNENEEGEAGSSSIVEGWILESIQLNDKVRLAQVENSLVSSLKEELSQLSVKLQKFVKYDSTIFELNRNIETSLKISELQGLKNKWEYNLKTYEKYDADVKQFSLEQKNIRSKIGCLSCPNDVLVNFFKSCSENNSPGIKAQLTKCSYEDVPDCKDTYELIKDKPLSYQKLTSRPDETMSTANRWLQHRNDWYIWFDGPTVARAIIVYRGGSPKSQHMCFTLVLESGKWKIHSSNECRNSAALIAAYAEMK